MFKNDRAAYECVEPLPLLSVPCAKTEPGNEYASKLVKTSQSDRLRSLLRLSLHYLLCCSPLASPGFDPPLALVTHCSVFDSLHSISHCVEYSFNVFYSLTKASFVRNEVTARVQASAILFGQSIPSSPLCSTTRLDSEPHPPLLPLLVRPSYRPLQYTPERYYL